MGKTGLRPSEEDLEQLTAVFRVLSDKTRLSILMLLADGAQNVSSLCQHLKLPQPTVSHHLGLLRMSNIIEARRSGKQVFYSVNGRVEATNGDSLRIAVGTHAVIIALKE